ncbi:MAG TPA: hypothetical protein VHV82_10975 [Sporichthyaceae bacterium]|jgi:hypothetical protein|nr:hypothetical protein [Sporichthyaceae bacterium]
MRGTREGRRLFAACLGVGLALGLVAAIGAGVAFHHGADYVPCAPENPMDLRTCREIDLIGFRMGSTREAAVTVGTIVALLGWVLSVVAVLYSSSQQHRHDPYR